LLILGEPGAGKTTLLLELTRDLLDRAAQDERHGIPVVFNLSSWAEQQLAFADWLIDELNKRYDVPRRLVQTWVDAGLILPLLDGLDEVAADHREACAEAINAFRNERDGLLPMVVCSRVTDYEALTVRLRLTSAVLIQALSREQIQAYVDEARESLAGVRTVLHKDESLWELLNTPLMLSIAALAYQGRAADEIPASGTVGEHRTQLFAAYTDAMFDRRAKTTLYTRELTEHWLTWLARTMKDHSQTIFYLEWMQADWLPGQRQQRLVTLLTVIISGLLCGLLYGLVCGLVSGLVFGLLGGLRDGLIVGEIETQSYPNEGIKRSLRNALIIGLVFGLVGGLPFGLLGGLLDGLSGGLAFGPPVGLLGGLRFGGHAYLHHLALRLVLWQKNLAPLHYVRFLDYATARIFLRKVGGGYVFVHRTLLEYFAALHQTSAEPQN
jgi:hypothetical protein